MAFDFIQERTPEEGGKRLRGYGANFTYDWEALGAAFGMEVGAAFVDRCTARLYCQVVVPLLFLLPPPTRTSQAPPRLTHPLQCILYRFSKHPCNPLLHQPHAGRLRGRQRERVRVRQRLQRQRLPPGLAAAAARSQLLQVSTGSVGIVCVAVVNAPHVTRSAPHCITGGTP